MCRIRSAVASAKEQGKDSVVLYCEDGVAAQCITTQYSTPVGMAKKHFWIQECWDGSMSPESWKSIERLALSGLL